MKPWTTAQLLERAGKIGPDERERVAGLLARDMERRPDPVRAMEMGGVIRPAHMDGTGKPKRKRGAVRAMNPTELRFLHEILQPRILAGEFVAALPQALRLDFGDGTRYEPDFIAFAGVPCRAEKPVTIIEVKGAHVGKHIAWSERGMERYRRARDKWRNCFSWELWTLRDGGTWERE